jgi:hypothetical protein
MANGTLTRLRGRRKAAGSKGSPSGAANDEVAPGPGRPGQAANWGPCTPAVDTIGKIVSALAKAQLELTNSEQRALNFA